MRGCYLDYHITHPKAISVRGWCLHTDDVTDHISIYGILFTLESTATYFTLTQHLRYHLKALSTSNNPTKSAFAFKVNCNL